MAIENRLAFINVCSQSFKVTPEPVLPSYDYGSVILRAKKSIYSQLLKTTKRNGQSYEFVFLTAILHRTTADARHDCVAATETQSTRDH